MIRSIYKKKNSKIEKKMRGYRKFKDDNDPRKRRKRSIFAWCCCCSFFIVMILLIILIPILTIGTTMMTEPTILPCACNLTEAIDFSLIPEYDLRDGKCIASHPDGGIYFFTGLGSLQERMIIINPDIFNYTDSLLPTGNYPTTAQEITACVYYPTSGEFIVTDYTTDTLFSINPNGINGTVIGSYAPPLSGRTRGFALVNGTRLFGISTFETNLYEFDPTNGTLVGLPIPLTFNNVSVPSNGVTWDPFTKQMFIIYTAPGDSNNMRSIGVIDYETGIIRATCILEKRSYASLTFDSIGRFWVIVGNSGANSQTLYFTNGAPCVNE